MHKTNGHRGGGYVSVGYIQLKIIRPSILENLDWNTKVNLCDTEEELIRLVQVEGNSTDMKSLNLAIDIRGKVNAS